ncbi:methyl-accepting chemotaxis protein [Natronosalvus caseinilyticus]|uniref:methyl-accepting chemotaxis protein n=1 Tax=Natronosalvus caseinilyticus TaxID=2953747 RepID=UPI0028ACB3C3|nr:methyl-accepting chemotaxis protein [Natronosalvus caseinilyticus]
MVSIVRRLVPRVIRRSYALKFAIVLLVLGCAVGAIGLVATEEVQTEVQSIVHEDHGTLAVQQAQGIRNWNANNEETVEAMARSSAIESGDAETIQTYLDDEIAGRYNSGAGRTYPHIHYIDADSGDIVASTKTDQDLNPVSELEGEWFDDLESISGTVTTGAYQSGTFGGNEERVAYVTDAGDLQDGYLLAYTVPLSFYEQQMRDGDSGVVMLVDGQDRVIASSPTGAKWANYDESTRPLETARSLSAGQGEGMLVEDGAQGVLTSRSSYSIGAGEEYVVGAAPVPGTDWVALVHTPSNSAYGFVQNIQQYGIYATLGIVLLVVLVGTALGFNTSRSIDRLTTKAERMEEGDLDVELESPRIDSIGRLYAGFDSMRNSLKNQIQNAQNAREEAEQARAETEAINRHLEAKADEYRAVMQETAEGDLTARMNAETENEAMEDIALEFNAMVAKLEETTAGVKAFATDVATASEQVTASSEEVRSASEQVTGSIQEIADGAERQNQSLQSVNHEMNGLSTTTEEIAASSNQVADIAERTAQTGKRGRDAAQDAIEGMDAIETESEAAVADIEALEAEMEQIDELIEFISEVAKETNMLALNANIEASRSNAGEDGFSVVAGEVKNLAEETKDAAEDIEERLEAIQARTADTAESVTNTSERVEANRDAIEDAVAALDEIADHAEETNVGVQEISAATEEQAASTQEVVSMVDEAATISEETTAESENVAAAAEEQTTALTEVSRSASNLSDQATRLSEALDRFDTDIGPRQVVDAETAVPVAGTNDPTPLPETGSDPSLEDETTPESVDDTSESLEDQRVDADETGDVERADDTASGDDQGDDDPSDVFTFGGEN